jgi:hypothetical protein
MSFIKSYPPKKEKILLINTSFQELDHLAFTFCKYGHLVSYIRPYIFKNRLWELALSKVPFLGFYCKKFFLRRLPLAGLDTKCIKETGIFFDFLLAILSKLSSEIVLFNFLK